MQKGSGPRHIALSKNENELYVLNELIGSVSIFKKDKNGYLLMQTILVDTVSKIPSSAQIVINKKNKYLYVSNRAEANTIAVLKVKQNSTLELIQTISTNGIKPRNFILTPNEKFILAANQVSNTIQVLKVNKDGTLISTNQSLQVPNPVCILID
jgi:6-phosphogluconolactonase